jgi:hypothetical protein
MPGSHTQLFDERIDFRHDGSGEMRTSSVMHGDKTLCFVWRMGGYGVVECQIVYAVPEPDDQGQANAEDWSRLPFVFELHRSDTGAYWVLRQPNTPGFWELSAPVVPAVGADRKLIGGSD